MPRVLFRQVPTTLAVTLVVLTAALTGALTAPAQAQKKFVKVLWLGQAAFRITSPDGTVVVIDPFMRGNPKTPARYKDLKALGKVDLILVTHAHGDHFSDAPALAKLTGAKVGMNADLGNTVRTLGIIPGKQLIRFNKSGPIKVKGVTVTMVRAEHSSSLVTKNPVTGKPQVYNGGEPAGYIVELSNGFKIYHAGDTGVFGDMKFIGDYYKPDLALLPIGGHFTMDPSHAAYATNSLIKPKITIPMHYATFPPLKGTPAQFRAALGKTDTRLIVINPGEEVSF